MFPEISDDVLVYLNRRHSQEAFDLLFNRYTIFVKKWVREVPEIPFSEREYYYNMAMLEFKNIINSYEESSGLFYSFIKTSITRFLKVESIKYTKYHNNITFADDEYLSSLPLADKGPVVVEAAQRVGSDLDPLIKAYFNDIECKIINYKLDGFTYKMIADFLNVDIKKIDNTIQKYHKLIRNKFNV